MSPSTPEQIAKAELEFLLRDVVNKLHLIATLIPDRAAAELFNQRATQPLSDLRKRFELPSAGRIFKPKS